MCRRASCTKCGKVTWAGCGAHIDSVMRGVPDADRCRCQQAVAPQEGKKKSGWFSGWGR